MKKQRYKFMDNIFSQDNEGAQRMAKNKIHHYTENYKI